MKTLQAMLALAGLMLAHANAAEITLPAGTLELPEGYEFERVMGIDSYAAKITDASGFEISIDQGGMAGAYASLESNNDYDLIYALEIGGEQVVVARREDDAREQTYIVTWPDSTMNLFCHNPDSRQLSDFHAIALSFRPR
jgi:hypothetical protein